MSYYDIFRDENSIVEGAIMFIDISDSTAMKEKETEATWLTTFGWFFDTIEKQVKEGGGSIVKYLGDGALLFYDMDSVANAINTAIRIQEELKEGNRNKTVAVSCTIGIAEGKMRKFETNDGMTDYIGNTVDKAARLSGVASPKAIFVDSNTINSAAMNKISSVLGKILDWNVSDYIGEPQKIVLKGFSNSVIYHEIKWNDQAYGVKSQYATDIINKTDSTVKVLTGSHDSERVIPTHKRFGIVSSWRDDKLCGFIIDEDTKKSYYTNKWFIIEIDSLPENSQVYFLDKEPLKPGANRLAAAVIVVGNTYIGHIKHINYKNIESQLSSIEVIDENKNTMDIFGYLGKNTTGISVGDAVKFEVTFHPKGPSAQKIEKI